MGMVSVTLFVFFALFRPVLLYAPEEEERFYQDCMVPSNCGNLGEIKFPYTSTTRPYCGPFVVDGCDKQVQKIQFVMGERWYKIQNISQGGIISITDEEFNSRLKANSCESFNNLNLPNTSYFSLQITSNLTLFKCHRDVDVGSQFQFKYETCDDFRIYYNSENTRLLPSLPPNKCSVVQLPANKSNSYHDMFRLLTAKFSLAVTWDPCAWCQLIGSKCPKIEGNFPCANVPQSRNSTPLPPPDYQKPPPDDPKPQRGSTSLTFKLGLAALAAGIVVIILSTLCYCQLRKCFILLCQRKTGENQTIETFLRNYGPLAPKRYTYSEVKKMTESFMDKLGQGGYGGVFKGKLPDGPLVAVKVLKESKSNGEEFINEVASIGRTSHVNIVTLLGFCFEGSKRALIYEFMSNGSLEKYIYDENPSRADRQLGWKTSYQIAVGIARGLEYLHRGCNTRILHFDIKPHNILLDENFCPKISDFGLAKICTRKESIVSMAVARGTVGYIAPEVFCRNFGRVSHKSDVYSYGMLVLEMVGGRKNICVGVEHTSEIYFPHWIHKRLQLGEELELQGISNEEENRIARKMILASLWCIQTDPSNRPPMSEAVEMLQGRLESLTMPPKPYLSSPPRATHRSMENSSTTIITM